LNWILPSSGLLCRARWSETDVSGLPFGPIFNGRDLQISRWASRTLKVGPVGISETSVSDYLASRNKSEDRRIKFLEADSHLANRESPLAPFHETPRFFTVCTKHTHGPYWGCLNAVLWLRLRLWLNSALRWLTLLLLILKNWLHITCCRQVVVLELFWFSFYNFFYASTVV
jgi:hypothetical protein